jgi:hypothetical protein
MWETCAVLSDVARIVLCDTFCICFDALVITAFYEQ